MTLILALLLGSVFMVTAAGKPAPTKTPAPTPSTKPVTKAAAEIEIPKSLFVADTKTGRNPFFPPAVPAKAEEKPHKGQVDPSSIVLNGLTSPPKRTAMINGRTFEEGEAGDIKLKNGSRISIQCLEIRADAAIIAVNGQKRELRLRSGI